MTPPTPSPTIPRDVALNPLKVVLPGVVPGNVLEVDYNLQLGNVSESDPLNVTDVLVIVSFDGNPVAVPGGSFFIVNNTTSDETLVAVGQVAHLRGIAAVVIPPGATVATVELLYAVDLDLAALLGGTDIGGAFFGTTLKATEYGSDSVPQTGPSNLIPF